MSDRPPVRDYYALSNALNTLVALTLAYSAAPDDTPQERDLLAAVAAKKRAILAKWSRHD